MTRAGRPMQSQHLLLGSLMTLVAVVLQGCFLNSEKDEKGTLVNVQCYSGDSEGSFWKATLHNQGLVTLVGQLPAKPAGDIQLVTSSLKCQDESPVKFAMPVKVICTDVFRIIAAGGPKLGLVQKTDNGKMPLPTDHLDLQLITLTTAVVSEGLQLVFSNGCNATKNGYQSAWLAPNVVVRGSDEKTMYAAYMDKPEDSKVTEAYIYEPFQEYFNKREHAGEMLPLMRATRFLKEGTTVKFWATNPITDSVKCLDADCMNAVNKESNASTPTNHRTPKSFLHVQDDLSPDQVRAERVSS